MENSKKYKTLLIMTIAEGALILAAAIFILFSGALNNKQEYLLTQGQSANGEYVISVDEVGRPGIFKPNTVKAYYSDADHRHGTAVFTAEVDNGKKPLEKGNYSLEWEGDTAVLYLMGSNQTGTSYKINFDTAETRK